MHSSFLAVLPPEVRVGQAIEFSYPTDNRIGAPTRRTRRRFVPHKIVDTEIDPLRPEDYERRPDVCRGRYYAMGHDLDKRDWRTFYVHQMRCIRVLDLPLFSVVALESPEDPREMIEAPWDDYDQLPPHAGYIGPTLTVSLQDQEHMKRLVEQLNEIVAEDPDNADVIIPWPRNRPAREWIRTRQMRRRPTG